jgi:hypothetical protein
MCQTVHFQHYFAIFFAYLPGPTTNASIRLRAEFLDYAKAKGLR